MDRVEQHHERVVVTRNGRPAALRRKLDGIRSARRRTFRVLYRIDEGAGLSPSCTSATC
ncbi:MAG: hypothetical protein ACT4PW_03275 [Acidimicrobiia bacterium]